MSTMLAKVAVSVLLCVTVLVLWSLQRPVTPETSEISCTKSIVQEIRAEKAPMRLCRIPRIFLDGKDSKIVTFQCGGEDYFKFGEKLAQYHADNNSTTWGQRKTALPPGKSAFFFGNSHTRQLLESFLCQYHDQIVDGGLLKHNHNNGWARFRNNATVHWLTNSWVAFSSNWTQEFRTELSNPPPSLQDFDVIVLGYFNPVLPGSNYYKDMIAKSKIHDTMDMSRIPPTMMDINAASPQATLIGVGMFKKSGLGRLQEYERHQKALQNRTATVVVIDGRKHIGRLGECGANNQFAVDLCVNGPEAWERHRCNGPLGGIPDPTAWDLVEAIHETLTESK